MSHEIERVEALIAELEAIRQGAFWLENEHEAELSRVDERHLDSARNLLHYLALRRRDLRSLQESLASRGLSSLGRSESHVLATLERVIDVLSRLIGREPPEEENGLRAIPFGEGKQMLARNTERVFGPRPDGGVHMLVTLPSEAAADPSIARSLLENGVGALRINCAHDDPVAWKSMLGHIERARIDTGRECRILMDLGGPKLRTGPVLPGPRVARWDPKRDEFGRLVRPALVFLVSRDVPTRPPFSVQEILPADPAALGRLHVGDRIVFRDLRGRKRLLKIRTAYPHPEVPGTVSWIAESRQTTYLGAETLLERKLPKGVPLDGPGSEAHAVSFVAELPPKVLGIDLTAGDTLVLDRREEFAEPVERGIDGRHLREPRISCSLPEVLDVARVGERVLFDDGKFETEIVARTDDGGLRLRVLRPTTGTKLLKEAKGINFPDTDVGLPALTPLDLEHLDFVARHADLVGLSFVNRASDVEELAREISRRTARRPAIVLKIETQRGFRELPRLLLAAQAHECAAVMIARGDLAVECGFERLAEVQEEILWLCEAAHVPVIWATQVLDRLAKKGMPTRAEVSDAALGERAECVMLNKGPHIVETVRFLRDVLGRMSGHTSKKSPTLRELRVSRMETD